jgi:hypothetical protein
MTSFVRNRLINDVYLPLIGNNLAKQMGTVGENKRTDLMGMLLLISPPGYGKTTLMEYVANRLGLVFMKINGPALGHDVRSIDPDEAPNATSRQEVNKINLALEMGNNVMLYIDDIQHTNPELLQKFISLCDAQRKIEGIWKGKTRTYDMRGKKFCVVMAGNPYTETGEKFRIPDMLANRADTYNLGDILQGKSDTFALSFIENALTSNPALAPLSTRDQEDVYKLIRMAQGHDVPSTDLKHNYSGVEISEIKSVFQRLFKAQDVLLKVNQAYIASASIEEAFRTEPPFKLQGSYRNMNKIAEKIVAAMNDAELERLITDHYTGEAQTLTTGAEHNLLKLAEMRNNMTPTQRARWDDIKKNFRRIQLTGGSTDDPVSRVTGSLNSPRLLSRRHPNHPQRRLHTLDIPRLPQTHLPRSRPPRPPPSSPNSNPSSPASPPPSTPSPPPNSKSPSNTNPPTASTNSSPNKSPSSNAPSSPSSAQPLNTSATQWRSITNLMNSSTSFAKPTPNSAQPPPPQNPPKPPPYPPPNHSPPPYPLAFQPPPNPQNPNKTDKIRRVDMADEDDWGDAIHTPPTNPPKR